MRLAAPHLTSLGFEEIWNHLPEHQRVSAIECELEGMEARLSEGQPLDVAAYARLTGVLCRLLELIGIRRLTKPLDLMSELAKALEGYAGKPIDDEPSDDDEPAPIEEGFDREPGEA